MTGKTAIFSSFHPFAMSEGTKLDVVVPGSPGVKDVDFWVDSTEDGM